MRIFLLLSIILSLSICSFSQTELPIDEKTGLVKYEQIVVIDSTTQGELFSLAMQWFAESFRSSQNVIQYFDKESGKIIGKGNVQIDDTGLGFGGTIHPKQSGHVDFKIEFTSKDNRYRIIIEDFIHVSSEPGFSGGDFNDPKPDCGTANMMKKTWHAIQEQCDLKINNIILSLEHYIKTVPDEDDNW